MSEPNSKRNSSVNTPKAASTTKPNNDLDPPAGAAEEPRCAPAWKLILILIALCVPLFFFNLGDRDLWNPDEPKYAQIVREMLETGDWIMLHINGKPYPDKPPLFFWLAGVCSLVNGNVDELTARIPSAASALLCVLIVFALGRKLFGAPAAFLGAVILATSGQFLWEARWAETDMMLTLFITAALTCFYYGYRAKEKGAAWYVLFYICMGLGTLTKGPLGFLLPLLVIVTYLAWTRELRLLLDMRLGLGLIIICAIVLPWLLTATFRGGSGFSNEMLVHHIIVRYFKGANHIKPWYHYFPNLIGGFFPWSAFLISALIFAHRAGRYGSENRSSEAQIGKEANTTHHNLRRRYLLVVIWFTTIFIFFTLSPTKQGVYLLPLYPAASLLVAVALEHGISAMRKAMPLPKLISIPAILLMLMSLLFGVAIFIWSFSHHFEKIPVSPLLARSFAAYLILATMATLSLLPTRADREKKSVLTTPFTQLALSKDRRAVLFFSMFIMAIYVVQIVAHLAVLPRLDEYKSAKPLCEKLLAIMRPEDELAMFGKLKETFVFYTGRKIIEMPVSTGAEMDDLRSFFTRLSDAGKRGFCIMRRRDYEGVKASLSFAPYIVTEGRFGGNNDMVVISNLQSSKLGRTLKRQATAAGHQEVN